MANTPVIHFEIQADDPARAKNFYEKAFGWDVNKYGFEGPSPMDYWVIKTREDGTPGINGGMYKRDERKLTTFDCTILVPDIDKAIADVKANGGTISGEKTEMKGLGWFARGTDTEGNTFGLMQATEWQAK